VAGSRRSPLEDVMTCPVCPETLTVSNRQGIEIDVCPKCRGVWLDRGELDKLLEREAALMPPPSRERARNRDDDDDYREGRRRSMWRDLFD
jgi:uncharacterized protein